MKKKTEKPKVYVARNRDGVMLCRDTDLAFLEKVYENYLRAGTVTIEEEKCRKMHNMSRNPSCKTCKHYATNFNNNGVLHGKWCIKWSCELSLFYDGWIDRPCHEAKDPVKKVSVQLTLDL